MNIKNMRMDKAAGIVLAGGISARMGSSKALLDYHGKPLVEHMTGLLKQAGCIDAYVGGAVPGYDCIPDAVPHEGPARAMIEMLSQFAEKYNRLLFVPVDMPLIPVKALDMLLRHEGSVFFAGHPLPACLATGVAGGGGKSVKELLVQCQAAALDLLPVFEAGMKNCNTREEWEAITNESAYG